MRGVVDCFGSEFEKIFSKPAPEAVEQEFGDVFASGIFLPG